MEKMLGIHFAKHTIQFHYFNRLLTRHDRKWARGFIFCRINLGCENKVGAETPPVESHWPRLGNGNVRVCDWRSLSCQWRWPAASHDATGPFISVLLSRLENLLENSIAVNLLVTGILAQLASYPQPLLRSFLLSMDTCDQPNVRTLHQVTDTQRRTRTRHSFLVHLILFWLHVFQGAGVCARPDRTLRRSQTRLSSVGHSGLEILAGQRPRQQI